MKVMFGSFEEMMELLSTGEKSADLAVKPWQRKLKPGDFAVRWYEGMTIYSEILDPVALATDDEGREYIKRLYALPHMKNYRFTRSYSVLCPEGELGDVHVSSLHQQCSEEQWARAVEKKFPSDEHGVAYVATGQYPPHAC